MVLAQIDKDKPIQYILGRTEFYGLWFEVTSDTFIPRPETEVLAEYVIQNYKGKKIRIIDLGTGSGCIAVTLAKNLEASVYAVDISTEALEIARRNAIRHGVGDRIEFYCSDWFDSLRKDPVDLIVSNPPYIALEEWNMLPANVKNYEPRVALWGGRNGLDHYKTILSSISRFLVPGGELVLEIGWNQGKLVENLVKETGNFKGTKIIKDHENRDRIVIAKNLG